MLFRCLVFFRFHSMGQVKKSKLRALKTPSEKQHKNGLVDGSKENMSIGYFRYFKIVTWL